MPHKYYMGVDKRYDHSMRIPRPDLSVKLGTPNACTNCHDDKTEEWALQWVNKWYGERRKPHYGTVLYDALNGKAGADSGLLKMINSNLYPEIIRATAIGYLSAYRSPKAAEAVKRALNDPDPLLRYAAVQNYMASDSAGLFNALVPLVNDPVKLVRMEAGNRLSTYRKSAFNPIQYEAFVKALDESKKAQEYMADFPSGSYNLGNYYAKLNNLPKAEAFYKAALEIDNLFYPAKTNLAMIYYQQGKTDLAATIYRDIVAKHPETTDGYYYLALLYSEQKKYPEAIGLLEKAVTLPGNNPRLFYNLGLLYQMVGSNEQSSATFVRGLQMDPGNFDLLYALFVFHLNQKNMDKARLYIEQLVKWYPNEPQVQEMYRNFMNQR
jgi:tetratricopeptide (TPR) repeat protein